MRLIEKCVIAAILAAVICMLLGAVITINKISFGLITTGIIFFLIALSLAFVVDDAVTARKTGL
jgi:hypothetical protein